MLKGLTTAGIGDVDSINQFVKLASAHQFDVIDSDGASLDQFIKREGLENAKAFLQDYNIQIGTIGLSVEWRRSEEEFQNGLKQLVIDAEAASSLGCQSCVTYILPSTDLHAAQFMAIATRRLRVCAQILGSYGISLGLEFVGPHHLRTNWKNPFIWNMEQTLDFISAINEQNVGLLVDAYHCYTNRMSFEELTKLNPSQIVHVHINDAKDLPIEQLLDNDRLYPGEGVIDLQGFLKALKKAGYEGPVSQEVLTKQPPEKNPEELLKYSAAAYEKLFKSVGFS
ncbi:sugar phosphate isomerase/epimerase family protein [Aquibacillus albus]|uniref:Sugar phosphate isomerase/epimerase n=1 Tax=Aquibacillus albus TaxID=1168171 RepID=A0ABS2MY87_9BACI|nr:sugar phosphate isomerase/epimerase family protein [Aquibacillus albus]MBM7570645.1 sugar phosphate isomerase/epimerase [Aquibacillus albus]